MPPAALPPELFLPSLLGFLLDSSTSSGGSISSPGMAALAGCLAEPPNSGGMGEAGRRSASDSACRAGVDEAGVPRARVESPKRASMSSRRTPHVSG